jgi:hypothetical protein
LNCHSSLRQAKEEGIDARRIKKYKSGLNKLVNKIKNSRKPVFENEVNKNCTAWSSLSRQSIFQNFNSQILQ